MHWADGVEYSRSAAASRGVGEGAVAYQDDAVQVDDADSGPVDVIGILYRHTIRS
jgi:hypothetical protein